MLAITGASAALALSDIPLDKTIAGVRVGLVDGEYVINPTFAQRKDSRLDLIVAGSAEGLVRIGPISGGEPRILVAHDGPVLAVAVSSDGRWIASTGADRTIRLWPMPDLSRPPLHTLSRGDLLARLASLTNLRVVADTGSPTGWKVAIGPFPGWEETPRW